MTKAFVSEAIHEDQSHEIAASSDGVRMQLEHAGRRSRRSVIPRLKAYLPAAVAGLLLILAVISALVGARAFMSSQGNTTRAAPSNARSAPTTTTSMDPERLTILEFMTFPLDNPRTVHVSEPTAMHVAGSMRTPPTGPSCTVYPDGVLRELGTYQDRILARYEPTGRHGTDECKDIYVFWVQASLFTGDEPTSGLRV